ncbi:FG-GAP repeat domain-containing protein [Embleya sp. NPDC020886]|uniref:FG-GAP repeat domain-containing protein n=1 Tax=Embleya sp. NPDC020886 TaxID=3363980 RepID=UPI00378C83A4
MSLLLGATAAVVLPGSAQALITDPDAPITVTDASTFGLAFDGSARQQVVAAEQSYAQLAPVALTTWLGRTPNVGARLADCKTAVPMSGADGFCWTPGSSDETSWRYVPQGLATSGESSPATGLWNGRRIVAVAWAASYDHPTQPNSRMRVSFTDVTDPAHPTYRSALLATPTGAGGGFQPMEGHADTLAWYGGNLLVFAQSEVRVFDLNHLWSTTVRGTAVGVAANGSVSADLQEGVLPQVARYTYRGGTCGENADQTPCFASGSIDHSGATPALVTLERTLDVQSRAVRWPLDPVTSLFKQDASGAVRAEAAYNVPFGKSAGVAMRAGQFVVTGGCPNEADAFGEPNCIYRGSVGRPLSLWAQTPAGIENVSFDPSTGQLWIANESPYRAGEAQPRMTGRVVYHVPFPTPYCDGAGRTYPGGANGLPDGARAVLGGDFDGDGCADMGVVQSFPGGRIGLYRSSGRPDGSFDRPVLGWESGPGGWWFGSAKYVSGDFNGDGKADIAGFYGYADGSVQLHTALSTGAGFAQPHESWGVPAGNWDYNKVVLLSGDFNGDGRTDVGAVYGYDDGRIGLFTFTANAAGDFAAPQLGWMAAPGGWWFNSAKYVAGDFNGDGKADIAGFYGYSNGGVQWHTAFSTGTGFEQPAEGWSAGPGAWEFNRVRLTSGDFDGDGRADVAAMYDYGSSSDVHTFTPGANGRFTAPRRTYSLPGGSGFANAGFAAGDVNGDHRADVFALHPDNTQVDTTYTTLGEPDADLTYAYRGWTG